MNRKKKLFIISAGLILVGFSATAVNAATTTANNIDVILEQLLNAPLPIEVIPSGIEIDVNDVHP